jgi:hypothetical protein
VMGVGIGIGKKLGLVWGRALNWVSYPRYFY